MKGVLLIVYKITKLKKAVRAQQRAAEPLIKELMNEGTTEGRKALSQLLEESWRSATFLTHVQSV
jgi:hypothetical protein